MLHLGVELLEDHFDEPGEVTLREDLVLVLHTLDKLLYKFQGERPHVQFYHDVVVQLVRFFEVPSLQDVHYQQVLIALKAVGVFAVIPPVNEQMYLLGVLYFLHAQECEIHRVII